MNTFEEPVSWDFSDDELIIITFVFLVALGAIAWKLTNRTKERRYFTSEVKNKCYGTRITNVRYVKER